MLSVWHISRGSHFIEVEGTDHGHDLLKAMRGSLPEYKGRHIKRVLQAYPDQIIWGKEYEHDVPIDMQNAERHGIRPS